MSRRQIIGFAAACVACCILGVLGAIAALDVLSTLFIGVAGLVIAAVTTPRSSSCEDDASAPAIPTPSRSQSS